MIFLILTFVFLFSPVCANEYNLYSPQNFRLKSEGDDKILFIVDFSNSMTEYLNNERKVDVMLDTLRSIISKIDSNTQLGLRVYGHKGGITAFDACKASTLMVPIASSNSVNIIDALGRLNPRGMTPITYSLKQAVKKDFLGVRGNKRIILLTDGGENCDESPCDYVMELITVRKDIHIDVIAFNVQDEEDLAQLECTAMVTSGKFYTANTAAELVRSLDNILQDNKKVEGIIINND